VSTSYAMLMLFNPQIASQAGGEMLAVIIDATIQSGAKVTAIGSVYHTGTISHRH